MTDTLHDQLIAELLGSKENLTPPLLAARNEILALRERLAQVESITTQQHNPIVGSASVSTETDDLKAEGKKKP
jgi:hypothetical protein